MNEKLVRTKQRRLVAFLKSAAILVVGLGLGSALIYSLQPNAPPPPMLAYYIFLLDSEIPIANFEPYVAGQKKGLQGIGLFTSSGTPATLNTVFPAWSASGRTRPQFRIDVVGERIKDRVHTSLTFYMPGLKTEQTFQLKEDEFRVLDLTTCAKDQKYHYAIIQVESAQPPPAGAVTFPNPTPARTRTSPAKPSKR